MLFIFMGESCTGKSSIATKVSESMNIKVYTGKDFLKLSKNQDEAWNIFSNQMNRASAHDSLSESIIYVITERDMLSKLQKYECKKIKFEADLDIIKSRFTERMNNRLPKPIETMLERKHKEWMDVSGDLTINTTKYGNINENIDKIIALFS